MIWIPSFATPVCPTAFSPRSGTASSASRNQAGWKGPSRTSPISSACRPCRSGRWTRPPTPLERGIDGAERRLAETAELRPATAQAVAGLLGMTNAPHSRRMACAIIANALIFHERLAGMYPGVRPLNLVCGEAVANPQNEVLAAWTRILEINYWPIFAIAREHPGAASGG